MDKINELIAMFALMFALLYSIQLLTTIISNYIMFHVELTTKAAGRQMIAKYNDATWNAVLVSILWGIFWLFS